jgi:hypothetical protein
MEVSMLLKILGLALAWYVLTGLSVYILAACALARPRLQSAGRYAYPPSLLELVFLAGVLWPVFVYVHIRSAAEASWMLRAELLQGGPGDDLSPL